MWWNVAKSYYKDGFSHHIMQHLFQQVVVENDVFLENMQTDTTGYHYQSQNGLLDDIYLCCWRSIFRQACTTHSAYSLLAQFVSIDV